ncbi:matrixin family metalloprotease [Blastopirellula sp. JC732]|uniref:Matrixin family metalloprotease n=1 Tax=Blastopirellula sediminis TaxID=2894196 RepID=A0A9X1SI42_9BACT|nr:matrixin family metalloprotease [Blastopirellula sediminis]MCC9605864.1 matrixin family metalloprotease [Blastopirellula sediminis]MCC9630837.1 matrixin family metalloprotease [Blastopirellula sediminis]
MRKNRRLEITAHNPAAETLELRLCLSSVGWDGAGQGSATLTYYVGQVPESFSLTQAEVESAVSAALKAWSDVIDVTFVETTIANLRDSIDIEFGSIDGSGGTLAQAYFPDDVNPAIIAGDVLVDIAETWEIGNNLGSAAFDLTYVLVHELGHSLGLEHSDTPGSVMYPSVSPSKSFTELSSEDVDAALALYAPAELTTAAPDDTPTEETPTEETPTDEPPTETPPTDPTEDPTEDPTDNPDDGEDDPPTDEDPEDDPEETPPSEDDPTEDPTDPDDDEDDTDQPPTEEEPTFPPFGRRWGRSPFSGFSPRSGRGPFQRFAGNTPQNSVTETSPISELFVFVLNRRR